MSRVVLDVSFSLPRITLKVLHVDGGHIWVTIGRTDPLKRLKLAYAEWARKCVKELDFYHQGIYIFDIQMASLFGLKDGDTILVSDARPQKMKFFNRESAGERAIILGKSS